MLQIALTANLFEWYDFALAGYMALEIGKLFFPATAEHTALMLSFSVFAISYLIRPLGSVFFGAWGNRYGSGAALKLSLVLMAVPAALIAFLPTYQTAGYWATGLLIALRITQGFAAGGEGPITGYYVSVNTHNQYRSLYCAMVSASTFLGLLLASFVVFALPFVTAWLAAWLPAARNSYLGASWRWPFLLTIPMSFWIFRIRRAIPATTNDPDHHPVQAAAYAQTQSRTKPKSRPRPLTPLIQTGILVAFMSVQVYTLFVWMPSYLHSYLGIPLSTARASNVLTLIAFSLLLLLAGYMVRWIAAPKLAFCTSCIALCSYPLFLMLQNGGFWQILLVQLVFACGVAGFSGPIFMVLPDLFRDNWQSLGMATAYTIPMSLFGGTAPVVCGFLIDRTHLLAAPALYLTVMGILALPVAYRLAFPKQQKKAITDNGYGTSSMAI